MDPHLGEEWVLQVVERSKYFKFGILERLAFAKLKKNSSLPAL
jgi:hypothetical protein